MKQNKIDWINHTIAFFGALAGIFLAFQLDGYQEEISEKEKANKVLLSIREELESNKKILEAEIPKIQTWLDCAKFDRTHLRPTVSDGIFVTERELNSALSKWGGRFTKPQLIRNYNDSINIYERILTIDFLISEPSKNNWEAAKFSGALNHIDHDIVAQLSLAYYWLDKPYGESEKEEIDLLLFYDKMPPGFIEKYETVKNSYQLKLGKLNETLSKIN